MNPYYSDESVTLYLGDALDVLSQLPDGSVDCCVTSPPYFGLRDYGVDGQYGLEPSPAEYVETMRAVFAEVRRVLAKDGTLFINIGDSYYSGRGNPGPNADDKKVGARRGWQRVVDQPGAEWGRPKSLIGVPWRVAFALMDDGWTLRNDVIWHKPGALPTSSTDRFANKHEYVFFFTRSRRYWFDREAVLVPAIAEKPAGNRPETSAAYGESTGTATGSRRFGGNASSTLTALRDLVNPGDVWTINPRPFAAAHFAVMPYDLADRCIKAGCKPAGVVLDPFSGSGTTGLAATKLGRRYVGIDLNRDYLDLSLKTRLAQTALIDGEAS